MFFGGDIPPGTLINYWVRVNSAFIRSIDPNHMVRTARCWMRSHAEGSYQACCAQLMGFPDPITCTITALSRMRVKICVTVPDLSLVASPTLPLC